MESSEDKSIDQQIAQISARVEKCSQLISVQKAILDDFKIQIAAWKGYTNRRVNEFIVALNQNTRQDKLTADDVTEIRNIVLRLNRSERAIQQQEIKHKRSDKSNIVVYGSLLVIAYLVIQGKIESGDIIELLTIVLSGAVGVGAIIKAKDQEENK